MRTWAVSLVLVAAVAVGCSGAEPLDLAEFPPDGVLDCTDDSSWATQGAIDPDAIGFATADEALAEWLAPFLEDHEELRGPQYIREGQASLLDSTNREVVVGQVTELSPDNWVPTSVSGCSGFENF